MSLAREVNHELEWEEDCCDKEPAIEYMLRTIVEEEKSYEDLAATTTTHDTVGIVEEEKCGKDSMVTTTTSDYGSVVDDKGQWIKE